MRISSFDIVPFVLGLHPSDGLLGSGLTLLRAIAFSALHFWQPMLAFGFLLKIRPLLPSELCESICGSRCNVGRVVRAECGGRP
jgi:hypothetical protein